MGSEMCIRDRDNTDLGFDNSLYHAQPHPMIVYYLFSFPVVSDMFHVPLLVLRLTPFISNRIDLVLLDLQSSGAPISTLAFNHSTLQ